MMRTCMMKIQGIPTLEALTGKSAEVGRHLLADAIAATEPRPRSGEEDQTGHVHCAMPVVCTMQNSPGKMA